MFIWFRIRIQQTNRDLVVNHYLSTRYRILCDLSRGLMQIRIRHLKLSYSLSSGLLVCYCPSNEEPDTALLLPIWVMHSLESVPRLNIARCHLCQRGRNHIANWGGRHSCIPSPSAPRTSRACPRACTCGSKNKDITTTGNLRCDRWMCKGKNCHKNAKWRQYEQ